MKDVDWESIHFFKKVSDVDNWGDPSKLDFILIMKLDQLRGYVGKPIIVTSGFRPNDPRQHGLGLAVDIVCPTWDKTLLDFYLAAERFGFMGIGMYRDWHYNGVKCGGLHVDERDLPTRPNVPPEVHMQARWLSVKPEESDNQVVLPIGKQTYLPFTEENLLRWKFIKPLGGGNS